MNCLLVPSLALDGAALMERLASTIDYPVRFKIVINNGRQGALNAWHSRHSDWYLFHYSRNLGCCESWNLFPKLFPEEEACLIVNEDEELQPGCLERICKASDEHAKDVSVLYVNQHESLGYFVWTKRGRERFGLFDENIWPAYLEDLDMKARFKIGGPDHYIIGDKSFPVKHGKPFPCSKEYHEALSRIASYNQAYYRSKWGGYDDWHSWMTTSPPFKTPFNNPQLTIRDWTLDVETRRKQEAIWKEFWERPTVSLYS